MGIYIKTVDNYGHKIIASEACGGVVLSDMTSGVDYYIPTTLSQYIINQQNGFELDTSKSKPAQRKKRENEQ